MSNDYFYPFPAEPGDNAIGNFIIGTSPIGSLPSFIWQDTVISQYANSDTMMQIIANMAEAIDQTADFDNFFDNIWNILTAVGYGLDVWGRILVLPRTITFGAVDAYFGFSAMGAPLVTAFGGSPFYSGEAPVTENYIMPDTLYRQALLAKAMTNIWDGSILGINAILRTIFPYQGPNYVIVNSVMNITYRFNFVMTPIQYALVAGTSVLPVPSGVVVSIVQDTA